MPDPNRHTALDIDTLLRRRRLLMVGGKGGVGKTTVASALALRAASLERRVLLVSTDPAHSLADAFDREIGDRETDLAANLTGLEIDPDSEVDAHLERVRAQMARFAGADQRPELERQLRLSRQSPGAQEAALLERITTIIDQQDRFDLIVFDRYVVRDVLPPIYFRNIAKYVRGGGAVLLSVGPEFGGLRSLARTPLADILPGEPTGRVFEQRFKPRISELGHRHPVTSALPGAVVPGRDDLEPSWGPWFRHIGVTNSVAPNLMDGVEGNPLLLMERVDEGRVALIASDHLWLWARGFETGGPQAELMRRIAHWLMKEPELDEEGLFAAVEDGELRIERRSLQAGATDVTVESPSGEKMTVTLEPQASGKSTARVPVEEVGLYRVNDGEHVALAPAGALNPLELADLRATDTPAEKIVDAANGGVGWLIDGLPSLRGVQPDRQTHGSGWLGFVRNEAFTVTGATTVPLAPTVAKRIKVLSLFM